MNALETEIKQAVHKYCQQEFSKDLSLDPPFIFSKEHIQKMKLLLGGADRSRLIRRSIKRVASCEAVLFVLFIAVCFVSPNVWAAVRNWYVVNIGPDQIVYEFEHKENDHAFLIVRPNALPDGLRLTKLDEDDGYSIQNYENSKTGEYITFSYHWLTVRERVLIERLIEQNGTVRLAMGYDVVQYKEKGSNKLVWYDKDSLISFWVESNLSEEELINAFDNMTIHPPVYTPTWMPEGYELVDSDYNMSVELIYNNPSSNDIIWITIENYGWVSQLPVWGEGEGKEVTINGNDGFIIWGDGVTKGTVLVFIDKNKNLVFTIQTGLIAPDTVEQIAKSLQIKER